MLLLLISLSIDHAALCYSFDGPLPGGDVTGVAVGRWVPLGCTSRHSIFVCRHVFSCPYALGGCVFAGRGAQQVWHFKNHGGVCIVSIWHKAQPGLVGAYAGGHSDKYVDQ